MAYGHISPPPRISGRGPIVPPYEPRYMLVPSGPTGGWGPYAQTQGPSQDLGYTPGALNEASPSTCPFTGDDNDDSDQFIGDSFRDDDFQ